MLITNFLFDKSLFLVMVLPSGLKIIYIVFWHIQGKLFLLAEVKSLRSLSSE